MHGKLDKDPDSILRICRLEGQEPTMREKWVAFYRMYRLACGGPAPKRPYFMQADFCWQLIFFGSPLFSRWTRLLHCPGDFLGLHKQLPKEIWRGILERERSKRLEEAELKMDHHVGAILKRIFS
jgi:hypothetical protein